MREEIETYLLMTWIFFDPVLCTKFGLGVVLVGQSNTRFSAQSQTVCSYLG